ncbi:MULTISPECIES: MFS transporter [unclassified Clostridium]|uniref:MFS transporter n=1 Tax=Clostridium TaxID=1485 RepID=UPI001C8BE4EF|nr:MULTISPECIES: MFS transporter [unclassified Clostridium]MBX9136272.1 MFS transporter [Clostridium sp. K12(2020)]MBX9143096.1 MFS transporter [Clostridium sp. K13]
MYDDFLLSNKYFRSFCIYRLIFGISYSLMIPILPLFFKHNGMSTVTIGIVISLYGVSKTIIQIPFGVISNNIGDKLTLKLSLLLMTFIPIGYILANTCFNYGTLYVFQGVILGIAAPATYSILSRTLDSNRRGECTGLASAVFTLGGGIGAAISGLILEKYTSFNLVFYTASIGIFFSLLYVMIRIKKVKSPKLKQQNNHNIKDILYEIKSRNLTYKIIILGASAFLGDYIYSCVVALIHFYGQEVLGVSTIYTSGIISTYLLVFGLAAPIAGWISDKIGVKKQLFMSFIVMIIALTILSMIKTLRLFTISIIIYFLGATFLNSGLQNSLLKFGEKKKVEGIIFGVVGACESLGYAIGPIILSYIYNINKIFFFPSLLISTIFIFIIFFILRKNAFNI